MRIVDPREYFELMSYCSKPGIDLWPSKPTYGALRAAIHARFDPQAPVAAGPPATYLVVRGSSDAASGDVTLDGVAKIEGLKSPGNPPTGAFTLRLASADLLRLERLEGDYDLAGVASWTALRYRTP